MSKDTNKPQAVIKFGSVEHERLVAPSYGMTRQDAVRVIDERKKDFTSVSSEEFHRARGLMQNLSNKPSVTATMKRPLSHGNY